MESAQREFFDRLLTAPGPSGYERPIQDVVRAYAKPFADQVQTDYHGNVTVVVNGDAPRRVMLAGHCDQIGMIVLHIDNEGYVYAQPIGGWDPTQLIGQRLTIWGAQGPVAAVISRKPIHLQSEEERKAVAKLKDLWLDIGATSRDDAAAVVAVGDPITLELGVRELRNGLVCGPGMDNRTGVWVVMEAARQAAERGVRWAVHAVSTVAEEIGLRGARTAAFHIDPEVGIAVDVTHATDCPSIDKRQEGEVGLGRGPVIYRGPNMSLAVTRRLVELAAGGTIPHQISAIGRATSNDANSIQVSRGSVATGLVSLPNRYMHSAVETVALCDLEHAARLLAEFLVQLAPDDDFTP
jgi:endoglucanase